MAFAVTALTQFVAGTGETTQYTTAVSTTTIVKNIVICNTTATERTLSLSAVPSGNSAGTANRILASYPIAPYLTAFIDVHIVLETGDFLSSIASAASAITVTISGLEET